MKNRHLPLNVLILDDRYSRGDALRRKLKNLHPEYFVENVVQIEKSGFESRECDVAIVHMNNKETLDLRHEWDRDNVRLIIFSGGLPDGKPTTQQNAILVGDEYLMENLEEVVFGSA